MEGERAAPSDEGGAGQGPPSVLSSSSSAAVSVASSSLCFGFSSSFPSSSAALDASSSSLMIMMMESEPTEAIRSLTAPSGELSRVETAQVVPCAVRSAIDVAVISKMAKFTSSPRCVVCLRHISLTQAGMVRMHGPFCTRCPGSDRTPW